MNADRRSVVEAEGDLLDAVREARWRNDAEGLTRTAYLRWHAAQVKMGAGRTNQRSLALLDGATMLASAEHFEFPAVLDGRGCRICMVATLLGADEPLRFLVDAILAESQARGSHLALLFAPSEFSGIGGNDLVVRPRELTLHVTEPVRYGAPMTTVRGGEERDLAAIAAMGERRAAPFRFHLSRDVDFIRYAVTRKRLLAGLGPMSARQLHFFIAEEGITAAAYVVISVTAGEWTLEECGDRDPSGARVGALLQALLAREPSESRPAIYGWLPAGFVPPQVAVSASPRPTPHFVLRALGDTTIGSIALDDILYWRNDLF